jgi:hypothetical protein
MVSDTNRLKYLKHWFHDVTVNVDAGVSLTGSAFWNTASGKLNVVGGMLGLGLGAGSMGVLFRTQTWVQKVNNPFLANVLRLVWDADITSVIPGVGASILGNTYLRSLIAKLGKKIPEGDI